MALRIKDTPELPPINLEKLALQVVSEIKAAAVAAKKLKLLLGISGGVDSSVLADLACRAVGADNVYGLQLTHSLESELLTKDSAIIARHLRLKMRSLDITPLVDLLSETLRVPFHGEESVVRRAQIVDRLRMMIMLDTSEQEGMLLLSPINRTEKLLGLGVTCGAISPVLQPLSKIYKTYVYELAGYLKLPDQIRNRQPNFEFWRNPADGDEGRDVFREVDKVLYLRKEKKMTPSKVKAVGFSPRFAQAVLKRLDDTPES
jgi:NAD+ synthase